MASTHLALDLGAGSGRAVAERTLASTSQLLDVRSGTWSLDVIQRLDPAPGTWPRRPCG